MFNNINTSGKATIFIKSAVDDAGKKLKKGDLITILKDVSFGIVYEDNNKKISGAVKNLVSFNEFMPSGVNIVPRNINESLADILFTKRSDKGYVAFPMVESYSSDEQGSLYLNNIPFIDNLYPVIIFDENKNKIEAFEISEEGFVSNLPQEKNLIISYYRKENTNIAFEVSKTSVPYVMLEIVHEVNLGNAGKKMLIRIPRASLSVSPTLDFVRGENLNTNLFFNIISGEMEIGFV